MRPLGAGIAIVILGGTMLSAQTTTPPPLDRVTFDVAGGASRFGVHGFGGLEVAMNRWLALRTEALFGRERQRENGLYYRSSALSFAGVLTHDREARVAPYLLGGYSLSVSQGYPATLLPFAGAGMRVNLGAFQPFLEARTERLAKTRLSFGIRF